MQAADCDADQDVLCSDAGMKKPGTLRVRASSQLWSMAFFIQQMFRKVKENLRQENLRQHFGDLFVGFVVRIFRWRCLTEICFSPFSAFEKPVNACNIRLRLG